MKLLWRFIKSVVRIIVAVNVLFFIFIIIYDNFWR